MATPYSRIYARFLGDVQDDYLSSRDDEDLELSLYPNLLGAINQFSRFAEHDLHKRNDSVGEFDEDLTEDEIEVLATLMKPHWLQRYINNSRKIEQNYYDAGIKTYSPNQSLYELRELYKAYILDAKKAIGEYSRKRVSVVGNFGGINSTGSKSIVFNKPRE